MTMAVAGVPAGLLRYRRSALEAIFLVTEAIAWFIVIAVFATLVERAFLETLADRIQAGLGPGDFPDPAAAEFVITQLREAAGQDAGPPLLVVFGAAAGGFFFMRLASRLDLGPGIGSAVLVAGSILAVNLLIHLAMGDLRIWDASSLVALLNDSGSQMATGIDVREFVADPDVEGPHGGAVSLTFLGLSLVWFRFLLAARSSVRLERLARSFTISFVAVLFALFVASVTEVDTAGRYAVPQFVLGMLGLAIGNHERAVPARNAEDRASPWAASVGGTLGLLVLSALVISVLAYLEFGVILSAVGGVLLAIIEFLLILVITPIYWLLERIVALVLGGRSIGDNLPDLLRDPITPADVGVEEGEEGISFPGWVVDSLKFFAMVGVAYVMYLVGRRILGTSQTTEQPVVEERVRATGGAGVGRLLADLISFHRRPDPDRWMNANEVYRLFGRAVHIARDRGLAMMPSETPDEFAGSAITYLEAVPVAEAVRLFERTRYGRHVPPREQIANLARSLAEWDRAHPATEALRERIRGQRPLDEVTEVKLRLTRARQGLNPTDEAIYTSE